MLSLCQSKLFFVIASRFRFYVCGVMTFVLSWYCRVLANADFVNPYNLCWGILKERRGPDGLEDGRAPAGRCCRVWGWRREPAGLRRWVWGNVCVRVHAAEFIGRTWADRVWACRIMPLGSGMVKCWQVCLLVYRNDEYGFYQNSCLAFMILVKSITYYPAARAAFTKIHIICICFW